MISAMSTAALLATPRGQRRTLRVTQRDVHQRDEVTDADLTIAVAFTCAVGLGDRQELPRRHVVQLLHGAGGPFDAHRVDGRRVGQTELGVQALLVGFAVAAGDRRAAASDSRRDRTR